MAVALIRVLVVDDHALIRSALVAMLDDAVDLKVVGEASNGADAVELAHRLSPDVVILDVDMQGIDAFHAAQHVLELRPDASIMFLTASDQDRTIELAIKAGALGYYVKSDDPSGIPAAVRAVARGDRFFSPRAAARLKDGFDAIRSRTVPGTRGAALSPRELEVLRYVGRGHPKKRIAEALGVSVKTVDKHVTSVMEKLDIHDRVELALYAVREGFISP